MAKPSFVNLLLEFMAKRLNLIKVAKDLNVGISTLVEHLHKQGIEIENSPRAEVSKEAHDVLLKDFQKSIAIKNQADQLTLGTRPKKEKEAEDKEKQELERQKRAEAKRLAEEDAKRKKQEEDLRFKQELERIKREEEEGRAMLAKKAREEELKKQQDANKLPKIVGKIDLNQVDDRGQSRDKQPIRKRVEKQRTALPEHRAETPAPQAVVTPPPAEVKVVPPVEIPTPTPPPVEEMIRAEVPQLEGLKIKGKINLDQFKKPKKRRKTKEEEARSAAPKVADKPAEGASTTPTTPATDADSNEKRRRKRRRRKVVKPASETPTTATTTPATDGNTAAPTPPKERDAAKPNDANRRKQPVRRDRPTTTNNRPAPSSSPNTGSASGTGNTGGSGSSNNSPSTQAGNNSSRRRRVVAPPVVAKKEEPKEVSQKEIQDKIKSTMARIAGGGKNKRQKVRRTSREQKREIQAMKDDLEVTEKIQVTEFITVSELASLMDISPSEILMTCMNAGIIVSINQRLDAEVIELIADEFEQEVEFISAEEQVDFDDDSADEDSPEDLKPRGAIVTVMGHVDHGKTSLLDYIRKANVADGEAGGITQHIGAYEVKVGDGKITFLDTPGHEAFTAMRARGAKVTDVAIVIIAADDSIMPQTKEAISHAQAAGVPIIFAINKVDKPGANPERIKEQLAAMNLLVEDWGGKYQSQDISAKKGIGIEELLEKIQLEAEILELKANPNKNATGVILEASLDKGRGFVTKMLVQAGTLKVGDPIVAGEHAGKVKAMFNERNKRVKTAGPSAPVLVLGLSGAPQAGERFKVMENEQEGKTLANKRAQINREQQQRATRRLTLDDLGRRIKLGNFKQLNLIVKGDVDGSIEALSDALQKQSIESLQINIVHRAVGQITESDVLLAAASDAIIIGFQVRPSANARRLAEQEGVDVRLYSVIYTAIDEIRDAMEGMLETKKEKEVTAQIEVRDVFKITKVGTIAGCYVQEGKVFRGNYVNIIRDGIVVYPIKEGQHVEIESLKRFKEDAKEVNRGNECGVKIRNYNDIKVGDIIEAYKIIEVKQTLEDFQQAED